MYAKVCVQIFEKFDNRGEGYVSLCRRTPLISNRVASALEVRFVNRSRTGRNFQAWKALDNTEKNLCSEIS